jgi:predicted ATP-grasp superfamily ATP-dependent carboligase
MKNFIVVGKSERVVVAVLQGIHCFAKVKCTVIGDNETRGLMWSSLCSRHIPIVFNQQSDQKAIDAINEIYRADHDVVLIPADCQGIRLINRIKGQLLPKVIPIPHPDTLDQMDDKWKFYEFCRANDLNVPTTYYIGSKADLDFEDTVLKLGLPFVLKPSNESGSFGVQIIRSKEHYLKAVQNNESYRFNSLIAQRYIEGEDVDISLLARHGRVSAFAIQQVEGSTVKFLQNHELQTMATNLCVANAFHGLMHIDARIDKQTGQVFLIESNPRFWASLTASVWCGLNFVEESIKEKIGNSVPLSLVSGRAYTRHPILRPADWITLLQAGQRGRLTRLATLDIYSFSIFMADLPVLCCRHLGKLAVNGFNAVRIAYGVR